MMSNKNIKAGNKKVPANHLIVSTPEFEFSTRSGRIDSEQRVAEVVKNNIEKIYMQLSDNQKDKIKQNLIKNRTSWNSQLKGTGLIWKKTKWRDSLHHKMDLATGMDSGKAEEIEFFEDMKTYVGNFPEQQIKIKDSQEEIEVSIDPPLLTVSPQSAVGQSHGIFGKMSGLVIRQHQENKQFHSDQIEERMNLLKVAAKDYGVDCNPNSISIPFNTFLIQDDRSEEKINLVF